MKRYKELKQEVEEHDDVLTGYATIHRGHEHIDRMLSDDDSIGFAGLRGIKKPDDVLDESFIDDYTIPFDQHKNKLWKDKGKFIPIIKSTAYFAALSAHRKAIKKAGNKETRYNEKNVSHHTNTLNAHVSDVGKNQHPLVKYTEESHKLNGKLLQAKRRGKQIPKKDAEHIKAIDRVTHNGMNQIKKPMTVYSGIGKNFASQLSKKKLGSVVHFPAYTSTSLDHNVATHFVSHLNAKASGLHKRDTVTHFGHMAVFHLPKGYAKGIHVRSISKFEEENEMTLHRDQHFKLVRRSVDPIEKTIYHHFEPHEK